MTRNSSRSSIANQKRRNDNMLAVADAFTLQQCCTVLTQALHVEEGGDRNSLPSVRSSLLAQHLLKWAIGSSRLRVRIIHHGRECILAPFDILASNVRYGILKTFGSQPDDLEGAVLWVRRGEWAKFLGAVHRSGFNADRTSPPARNRQLDHDKIIEMASAMRNQRKDLSIGAAAASIACDLPRHPKTGKKRDTRNIERIISHLWEA